MFGSSLSSAPCAGLAAATVPAALAAWSTTSISATAVATQGAVAAPKAVDVVSVSQTSFVTADVSAHVPAAARVGGASLAEGRGASLGMVAVWHGGEPGAASARGLPDPDVHDGAAGLCDRGADGAADVASVVGGGSIVMGDHVGRLRGAQAGDSVVLVAADGTQRTFTIGFVAPDDTVGGTEILMSNEQADSLGVTTVSRVLLFGFGDASRHRPRPRRARRLATPPRSVDSAPG